MEENWKGQAKHGGYNNAIVNEGKEKRQPHIIKPDRLKKEVNCEKKGSGFSNKNTKLILVKNKVKI